MSISLTTFVKFQETVKSPQNINVNEFAARSFINSYSIVTDCSWTDAVKKLTDYAHIKCDMPLNAAIDMLQDNDFVKLKCDGTKTVMEELTKRPKPLLRSHKYILKIYYTYLALLPDGKTGNFIIKGVWNYPFPVQNCKVQEIWMLVPGSSKIFERGLAGVSKSDVSLESNQVIESNSTLNVSNVNPQNIDVGDCYIRALSKAYDCSWHDALNYASKSICYSDPVINHLSHINETLKVLGFKKCKANKRHNSRLTGAQFCKAMNSLYCNGERIFAMVGRNHCVAVVSCGDNGDYKIIDAWDCSNHRIYEYWVLSPSDKCVIPELDFIEHTQFGRGYVIRTVDSGEDKAYLICFESAGTKIISKRWLVDNRYIKPNYDL